MSGVDFYSIDRNEKAEIFSAAATALGLTAFAVEKDWWVCTVLGIIFQMDLAQHLIFKGGTSLSKAWKLIYRFSEDIDLAIDREFFGFIDAGHSNNQISKLRKVAGNYIAETFYTQLQREIEARGFHELQYNLIDNGSSDQDPRIVEVYYSSVIQTASAYILPKVQIEISSRSMRGLYSRQRFGSMVDELYTDRSFTQPFIEVTTAIPERTFLEKLFLLHEEFQRPERKRRVDRLSRHLYDIYHLSKAGIAEKALNDKNLYQSIVAHRHAYSRIARIDYNTHHPKTLNPVPPEEILHLWRADYSRMMQEMIYDVQKPSFENLLNNVQQLKTQLQLLDWSFDLEFHKLS